MYTNCIDHLFAESHRYVCVVDPRYFKGNLIQYVTELNPDDAIVMLGANCVVDKDIIAKLQ